MSVPRRFSREKWDTRTFKWMKTCIGHVISTRGSLTAQEFRDLMACYEERYTWAPAIKALARIHSFRQKGEWGLTHQRAFEKTNGSLWVDMQNFVKSKPGRKFMAALGAIDAAGDAGKEPSSG